MEKFSQIDGLAARLDSTRRLCADGSDTAECLSAASLS